MDIEDFFVSVCKTEYIQMCVSVCISVSKSVFGVSMRMPIIFFGGESLMFLQMSEWSKVLKTLIKS